MDILSMLESPSIGKLKPRDNPKQYLLNAIEEQKEDPSWVDMVRNAVSVKPHNRIFFPEQKGKQVVNKVIKGSTQKKDYTKGGDYHEFLDGLKSKIESGEFDAIINAWVART